VSVLCRAVAQAEAVAARELWSRSRRLSSALHNTVGSPLANAIRCMMRTARARWRPPGGNRTVLRAAAAAAAAAGVWVLVRTQAGRCVGV